MSQDGTQGRYAGGSVAGGRYQLRDLLGEGGMASVYLAYDAALDRQVAIKTLHTELGREDAFRERFRREAQAVAKLSHTNIVSVFDTGEDDLGGARMPYIVMEYVEGQPLGSVLNDDIQRYGAMPADKALKITSDVLAALETSHEMGLVHRDIKPGNVMMTKRGVVKVMDFGIARAMQSGVTSMTQTGMVVGTPQYLSPEQALGRGVDARSDLYSVGIMLFQLLTGRIPFEADSALAIAYAHVQEEPVAPSSINRTIPPAVDALVARALKKNPNERFPSAAAMADECHRVLASVQPGAAPMIVPGSGPVQGAGSGVGSAVFPPVDQTGHSAPSSGVQTPYTPPAHHPYGPATPAPMPTPAPQPAYGYPPQQSGYATPAPYAQNPTPVPTPLPAPAPAKKKNTPMLIGAVAIVLAVIGGVVFAILPKDKTEDKPSDPANGQQAGHKAPDRSKVVETTVCTDAKEDTLDPSKVVMPNFVYINVRSVKECAQAEGWSIREKPVDENQWGEEAVIDQFPRAGTAIDPKSTTIELTVSTGNPAK
ncbi:protein kinase [Streptomyces sp. NBC_00237]|uniref:protein kinase domain-containing protein n=1 Tax=Streptomyces sp. NBC_00237 TaxID=2975687 RepID=UPI0022564107|nr:protein kinase [Streptomyces sp. NBC_00237]MCX5200137.1 protein kinase [Streptomyces sp. NBC_00237]